MNAEQEYKFILGNTISYKLNISLLIIHFILMVCFFLFKAYIMVGLNVVSIFSYIFCFYLIRKKHFTYYVFIVYFEVWIHMTVATIVMGWECGFQLYCFALIPPIFYISYLSSATQRNKIRPILISIITSLVFLFAGLHTVFGTSIYKPVNPIISFTIFCINTLMVFSFIIIYLMYFTKTVIYSESLLKIMAEHDELTGVYNRYRMKYLLDQVYANALHKQINFSIAILDIDDFKLINDTYGHNCGDFILKELSKILKSIQSPDKELCRWGGEEFMLLQIYDNYEKNVAILEALCKKINETAFVYANNIIHVSITCGISEFKKEMTIDELISKADSRLYEGKARGKNCVISK